MVVEPFASALTPVFRKRRLQLAHGFGNEKHRFGTRQGDLTTSRSPVRDFVDERQTTSY